MKTQINTANLEFSDCSQCAVRSRALFSAVDEDKVHITQEYRDKCRVFSAGDIIHIEKEPINYAFTLRTGCLILYNDLSNGERQILRVALPGDFVGFSRNRNGELLYSIKAETDSSICLFFDDNVTKMISENAEIAKRLIELQSHEASLCQQRLLNLGQKTATESLAYLIMELYSRIRMQSPKEFNFTTGEAFFPLSQADMGDALGLTKVHVNRVITNFKKQGLIAYSRKKIRVIDEQKLSEVAQFDIALIEDPFRQFI
ncbi:Crp/Fnr family transcriptional regulator [Bathymodiolus septemdierum thioautotrophic gill symbiont]|uniref:CRP/FNR family transcriptional regulator, anaerobic regulatory protein n=1 Tax=endosymbiont of Bathymodiolus septemdierum str. Myojin knoll TaxID=1303921 RepID=A0A0P0UPW4_9GAMM|nr:Crp/Fnr family transcriptional regulator [Bathymodiolus septemdierum thioautotrophic gill symbiont]BAS67214.1 CRP/FNR family transcriptional regulator, anaerobic regulatory protein [endosymbiont of Bathymodiolus septemdierum str. Myojin knoll]